MEVDNFPRPASSNVPLAHLGEDRNFFRAWVLAPGFEGPRADRVNHLLFNVSFSASSSIKTVFLRTTSIDKDIIAILWVTTFLNIIVITRRMPNTFSKRRLVFRTQA